MRSGIAGTNIVSASSAGIYQYNQPGPAVPGIMLDKSPVAIAFNPVTNRLYVAEMEFLGNSIKNYTVAVIDVSGRIINNLPIPNNSSYTFGMSYGIPIEISPNSIAVSPLSNLIYVSNAITGYVYVIDGRDNALVRKVHLGGFPEALAVDYGPRAPYDTSYVINQFSPTISVIFGTDFENMSFPLANASAIAVDPKTDKVFVASSESNQVSVLDTNGPEILKHIAVDSSPSSIAVNSNIDMIYLLNSGDNTVSVIDPYNDTKLASIPVGNSPSAIAVDPKTDKVFVANSGSNTVSVIDGKHYTVIDNIPVGEKPSSIAVNSNMSLIYVANSQSNTISVINEKTKNVMVDGTFNINPSNSGRIRCNGVEIATNDYVRLDVDTKCEAQANNGYRFISWSEQLGHNSSKTITASTISDSLFSSLLSCLGFKSNDNSTLNVSSYGTFVANFRGVPPPIPPEYSLALVVVILSSVLGWFLPNIASWANARRKRKSLRKYIDIHKDEPELDKLHHPKIMKEITDLYTKGKISEEQYKILKDMISDNPPDANKP